MYPTAVAAQLRRRGHDVEAVTARPELLSLSDVDFFATAQAKGRVVVTENIADFTGIADAADRRASTHHGLVLVDPIKYARGNRRTIGRMVRQLDALSKGHPLDDATGVRRWL
jgi:hypothetical protein